MNFYERAQSALAILGQDIRDGAAVVERLVLQAEALAGTVSTAAEQSRDLPPADVAIVAQGGTMLAALLHLIGPVHPDFPDAGKPAEPQGKPADRSPDKPAEPATISADQEQDSAAAVLAGRKLDVKPVDKG